MFMAKFQNPSFPFVLFHTITIKRKKYRRSAFKKLTCLTSHHPTDPPQQYKITNCDMSKQRKKHGRKGERLGSFDKELEHIGAFSITLSTNADRKVFDIPKLNEHEDKDTDGKKSSDDRDDVNNLLKRVF